MFDSHVKFKPIERMSFFFNWVAWPFKIISLLLSQVSHKVVLPTHLQVELGQARTHIGETINLLRVLYEPRCEKTGLRGFPDLTQTGLYNHTKWLEA